METKLPLSLRYLMQTILSQNSMTDVLTHCRLHIEKLNWPNDLRDKLDNSLTSAFMCYTDCEREYIRRES